MSYKKTRPSATARSAVAGSILLGWRVDDLLLWRQAMADRKRAKLRQTLRSSMTLL